MMLLASRTFDGCGVTLTLTFVRCLVFGTPPLFTQRKHFAPVMKRLKKIELKNCFLT